MREYMFSLGTVLMLIAFANMIIPEGNIKKYVSLATGFMIISTTLSILPGTMGEISFPLQTFEIDSEEIAQIEAQSRAGIIKEHRENIARQIETQMNGGKAYVEVTEQGEITSVTLVSSKDESRAVLYIIENFRLERERIKIKNDKD